MGEAMFTIVAAIAKLERDIICERVKSGMRRAKAEGKRVGRPKAKVDRTRISRMRREGMSLRSIATRLGVSEATVRRCVKRGAAEASI